MPQIKRSNKGHALEAISAAFYSECPFSPPATSGDASNVKDQGRREAASILNRLVGGRVSYRKSL